MQHRFVTLRYSLLQVVVWGSCAVILPYAPSLFRAFDFSDAGYSLMFGIACVAAVAVQMWFAELVTRLRRLTHQRMLMILGAAMFLLCAAMLIFRDERYVAVLSLSALAILVQTLQALVNSLGVAGMNSGMRINFGIARGIGSLGYALFAYLIGAAISRTGVFAVPKAYALVSLSLIVLAATFPKTTVMQPADKKTEAKGGSLALLRNRRFALLRNRRFALLIAVATLLFTSNNMLVNYLYQIIIDRGGNEANQGTASAIAAIMELPIMFLFANLIKWRDSAFWLKLSGIFISLKALLCLLSGSVAGIYAAQLMQMLGYAVLSVGTVYYIRSIMPPEQVTRSQSMFAATQVMGSVLVFATGGFVLAKFSVQALIGISLACGVLGAALLFLCVKKTSLRSECA